MRESPAPVLKPGARAPIPGQAPLSPPTVHDAATLQVRPGLVQDIALGQPLPFALHDAHGNLLLVPGSIVATEHQLQRLLERGFVVPCTQAPRTMAAALADVPAPPACVFQDVRALADALQALHYQLLAGACGAFEGKLWRLVARVEQLASYDADTALASLFLHGEDDGLSGRLVHAALLCALLADALELDAATKRSTLAAALTFDVAMTSLAETLNHQHSALTREQREQVDRHPTDAHAMLVRAGITDRTWLDGVLQHHERIDGSGYPARLEGEAICLTGRMLGIVDSFSAMVRPRAYRDAVLCRVALRELFLQRSRSVDEHLANLFVREVGLYPAGSLVRLASGEICIVVRRGHQVAHPDVRLLVDAHGEPDTAFPPRDTRQGEFEIRESVPLGRFRALLEPASALWMPRRAATATRAAGEPA